MEEEKYSFIVALLSDPRLTIKDRDRVSKLLSKEMDKNLDDRIRRVVENMKGAEKAPKVSTYIKPISHKPKDTAEFLSLFSQREGFKYLTHNFDSADMTMDSMLSKVRKVFEEKSMEFEIPKSLWALLNTFINGGKSKDGSPAQWQDFKGKFHKENYNSKAWIDWSHKNNNQHPLENEDFSPIIQLFRSTTRVVGMSSLDKLIDLIKKNAKNIQKLTIETENIDKADFYTNVLKLVWGIRYILLDMAQGYASFDKINISYKPELEGDFFLNKIIIVQKDSMSKNNIDKVIKKFRGEKNALTGEGGAFANIASNLAGYCNWSVESLFDGKPYRWNILNDNPDISEVEEINPKDVVGFKHILTYYSKG